MKNLLKREVRSHNKVRALFDENKVRFARAEKLCMKLLTLIRVSEFLNLHGWHLLT